MKTVKINGLAYRLTGLSGKHYFQKTYVDTVNNCTYSIERYDGNHAFSVIYQGAISPGHKDVTYSDDNCMIIEDGGHSQTLDLYNHNGNTYLLISVGANETNNSANYVGKRKAYFARHIGRIAYDNSYNSVDNAYQLSDIEKLYDLDYLLGDYTLRADAGLSDDKTHLVIMARDYYENTQCTLINNRILNNKWDNSLNNSLDLKNVPITDAFVIHSDVRNYLPDKSLQGISLDNHYNVFILGGSKSLTEILAIPWHLFKSNAKSKTPFKMKDEFCYDVYNNWGTWANNIGPEGVQFKSDKLYIGFRITSNDKEHIYMINQNQFKNLN